MRLLELHIDGFGKFHDHTIRLDQNINLIYGKNEAGKSTLHTFIRCMLFGMERGRGRAAKNDLFTRFEPWHNKGAYGGWIRLEKNGIIYRLERNFQKDLKAVKIIDETAGKEVEASKSFLEFLLCGLTETSYNNTISIGQLKSATDSGMVTELRNYIANMNTTGNMALNITKASSYLKNRRREFERQLIPDAGKNYTALLGEIRSTEKEISSQEYENQIPAYQNMRSQVKNQLAQKQEEREALLQKIAAGRQILDGAQFSDEASIIQYRNEASKSYEEYCQAKASSAKKGAVILSVLCFILAGTAGLGMGFFGDFARFLSGLIPGTAHTMDHSAFLTMCALFAVLFAGTGLLLILKHNSRKKETDMIGRLLQETFSRHLGDASISEDAMKAFYNRMEELIRLSQVLKRCESSVQELAAQITSLSQQETSCEDMISRQQRTQWELEKKLDHLTRCKDQTESLKRILAENERIREEISAIDLALETMTELSATIRDSFGLYLNKSASELVNSITGGIYNSISVDENLNIFLNTPTRLVAVDQVSSGTMDQIYLALRLSSAKLLQESSGDQMPLIFDDSFVLYDDERLYTAVKWLAESWPGQIIIFTCHRREAQMLTDCQIKYHMVEI